MAQSRLEKIGTIFSRSQGLRKSGAIKSEQVPIWAEVYEAFPPKYEPRWDATDSEMPVRKILYREDRVRAQYSKVFGEHEKIDLFSDSKPGSERFVEKFLAIHDSGEVAPDQVWERTIQALELEGVRLGKQEEDSSSEKDLVTPEKSPKPTVSFQDLFSKESQ